MSRGKSARQKAVLDVVRGKDVGSQEELRSLLGDLGFDVSQGTLSRDVRELRLTKVRGPSGRPHYALPDDYEHTPALRALLPALVLSAEAVGNLLVVGTRRGSAGPVSEAIDGESWPEIAGTIAGDDTILIVLRNEASASALGRKLLGLSGRT